MSSSQKTRSKRKKSVRENKYGLQPKPAVPTTRDALKGPGSVAGTLKEARTEKLLQPPPGGRVPGKAEWFQGSRVVKSPIDKRSFQRRPTDVPRRLVGRGLQQEVERQERAYRRTVARSNNFAPKPFDFVASLGTPDFTRVVLHQTAPTQRTIRGQTNAIQGAFGDLEERVLAAERFVAEANQASAAPGDALFPSSPASRRSTAASHRSTSAQSFSKGDGNGRGAGLGIGGGFGAGAAPARSRTVPSRSNNAQRRAPAVDNFETESEVDDDAEINAWTRSYRRQFRLTDGVMQIQTWYRMAKPFAKLQRWRTRRKANRTRHFLAFKALYLAARMNRRIQGRAVFLKWREFAHRKKYKNKAQQNVFDAVSESKTVAGNMALLLGIGTASESMGEMEGSAEARKNAEQRRALGMYQLRVHLMKKYFKLWRVFSIRLHRLRLQFATHIRNANKMLPAAEQGSQIWIGEWLSIIVQMWHRYSVFKKHVRENRPGLPRFEKPWATWDKWLRAHEARKLRAYRSSVLGAFNFVRRFLWRWKSFCRARVADRVNESRARQFHCRLVLRHWSNYVRSQGKDRRFLRKVVRQWRGIARQQVLHRAIHRKLTRRRERKILKVHMAALRFTVGELRVLRAHGRHKLLAPRGSRPAQQALRVWLGYSTKVTQLQAWREWRSVVARRKRWECFLFTYLKARVRNVCGRCFKAWRLIAAESRKRLVTTMELKGQLLHLVAQSKTFATHTMRELQYENEEAVLDSKDLMALQTIALDRSMLAPDARARQGKALAQTETAAFLSPLQCLRKKDLKGAEYAELQTHLVAERPRLLVAARRGRCDHVQRLINNGQPATLRDKTGATALILAAQVPSFAHFQCVHRLLEAGAPLKAKARIPKSEESTSNMDVDSDDENAAQVAEEDEYQSALEIASAYRTPAHTVLDIHLRRVSMQQFLKSERREYRLAMLEKWALFSFHLIWEFCAGKLVDWDSKRQIEAHETRRGVAEARRAESSYLGRLAAAKGFLATVMDQQADGSRSGLASRSSSRPSSAVGGRISTPSFAGRKSSERKVLRLLRQRHDKRNAVVLRTRVRQDARDDALVQRYEYRTAITAFRERTGPSTLPVSTASARNAGSASDDDDLEDDATGASSVISESSSVAPEIARGPVELEPLVGSGDDNVDLRQLSAEQIHLTVFKHRNTYPVVGVEVRPTLDDLETAVPIAGKRSNSKKSRVGDPKSTKDGTGEKLANTHVALTRFARFSPFTVHHITEDQLYVPIHIRRSRGPPTGVATVKSDCLDEKPGVDAAESDSGDGFTPLVGEHAECFRPPVRRWCTHSRVVDVYIKALRLVPVPAAQPQCEAKQFDLHGSLRFWLKWQQYHTDWRSVIAPKAEDQRASRAAAVDFVNRLRAELRRAQSGEVSAKAAVDALSSKLHKANAAFKTRKHSTEKTIVMHTKRLADAAASNGHLVDHIPALQKLKESTQREYLAKSLLVEDMADEVKELKLACTNPKGSPEIVAAENALKAMKKTVKSLRFRLENTTKELLEAEARRVRNDNTLVKSAKILQASREVLDQAVLQQQQFVMTTLDDMDEAKRVFAQRVAEVTEWRERCQCGDMRLQQASAALGEIELLEKRHAAFEAHAVSLVKHFNKMLNRKPTNADRLKELQEQETLAQKQLTLSVGSSGTGSAARAAKSTRAKRKGAGLLPEDALDSPESVGRSMVKADKGTNANSASVGQNEVNDKGSMTDDGDEDDNTTFSSYGGGLSAGLDKREQLELVYEQSKGVAFGRERQFYREVGDSSLLATLNQPDDSTGGNHGDTTGSDSEESGDVSESEADADATEAPVLKDLTAGLGYVGGNFLVGHVPLLGESEEDGDDEIDEATKKAIAGAERRAAAAEAASEQQQRVASKPEMAVTGSLTGASTGSLASPNMETRPNGLEQFAATSDVPYYKQMLSLEMGATSSRKTYRKAPAPPRQPRAASAGRPRVVVLVNGRRVDAEPDETAEHMAEIEKAKSFWQADPGQQVLPATLITLQPGRSKFARVTKSGEMTSAVAATTGNTSSEQNTDVSASAESGGSPAQENSAEEARGDSDDTVLGFHKTTEGDETLATSIQESHHNTKRREDAAHTFSAFNNLSLAANPERLAQPNPFLPCSADAGSAERYTLSVEKVASIAGNSRNSTPGPEATSRLATTTREDHSGGARLSRPNSRHSTSRGSRRPGSRMSTGHRQTTIVEGGEVGDFDDKTDEPKSQNEAHDNTVVTNETRISHADVLMAAIEQEAALAAESESRVSQLPSSRPSTAAGARRSRLSTPVVVSHESILDHPVFSSAAADASPPPTSLSRPQGIQPELVRSQAVSNDSSSLDHEPEIATGDEENENSAEESVNINRPPSRVSSCDRQATRSGNSSEQEKEIIPRSRQSTSGTASVRSEPRAILADDRSHVVDSPHDHGRGRRPIEMSTNDTAEASSPHLARRVSSRRWSFDVKQNVTSSLERNLVNGTPTERELGSVPGSSKLAAIIDQEGSDGDFLTPDDTHSDHYPASLEGEAAQRLPISEKDFMLKAQFSEQSHQKRFGSLDNDDNASHNGHRHHHHPSDGFETGSGAEDLMPGFVPSGNADIYHHRYASGEGNEQAGEVEGNYEYYDAYRYALPATAPARRPGQRPMYQTVNLRPDPLLSGSSFTDIAKLQRDLHTAEGDDEDQIDDNDGTASLADDGDDVAAFVAEERARQRASQIPTSASANQQSQQTLYFHRGQLQVSVPKKEFSLHQGASNPRELQTPLENIPGIGRAFGLRERVVPSESPLAYAGSLDLSLARSPSNIERANSSRSARRGPQDVLSSEELATAARNAGPDLSIASAGAAIKAKNAAVVPSPSVGSAHNYAKQRHLEGQRRAQRSLPLTIRAPPRQLSKQVAERNTDADAIFGASHLPPLVSSTVQLSQTRTRREVMELEAADKRAMLNAQAKRGADLKGFESDGSEDEERPEAQHAHNEASMSSKEIMGQPDSSHNRHRMSKSRFPTQSGIAGAVSRPDVA